MTNTLRESIMVAAMEGDLSRLLVLGRDGLGRPLLLGGETLNVLGWSGPPAMPRNAVWEDFIQEGFAPNFQWSDDLFESNSLDLSYGFSVCRVPHPEDNCADWIVDIEMIASQPVHLILSGKGHPELPPPDEDLLSLVCLAIRTCLNNRGATEPNERFSSEYLLLQLIRHKSFDEPLLRYRAQSVHMESEGFFALLMLDLEGYHPQRNSIATIRNLLSSVLNGFSVIDGEVLTFLVCHDTDGQEEKRQIWQRVEAILRDNGLFGMFSRTFYRLGDFHYHYVHTLDTLKLRFCAKLPTNRACGPVRRARRGVILNEKGVHHPFLAAFAAWLALCCAKMHGFATASFFPGRFFCFFAFFDSLKPSRPAGLFSYRSVIPPFPHKALLRKPSQGPRPTG